jgi:hypothetical protein
MLSTRDHGFVNKLYPGLGDFDYVVARVTIGGKAYMLDATDPLLSFGTLPLRCLNDQGRAFSLDKPSYWVDMVTRQRESTTYNCDLTLQDDGKLKGTISRYSSGYSSYLKRKEIKKFNSIDEYVEHVGEELPKIKIFKSNIINVDSLESVIGETYDVEIKPTETGGTSGIRLSPFMLDQLASNPFKLNHRDYPVDWGMPSDDRYIVTIHLPEKYKLDNPPQPLSITLPNQGGKFLSDFQMDGNVITYSYVTQINKPIFSPEEYPYLKELFNKIIIAEKSELVFKKKI